MKKLGLMGLMMLFGLSLSSQNSSFNEPRMFFSTGFVMPQFYSGAELTAAYDLREAGLSYYQDGSGVRQQVGSYSGNSGFSLSIGYYLPVRKVQGLGIGLLVNSGQTGSTPSDGGYAEGYYFNFLNFGLGAQYYPFSGNDIYLKAEAGMGSVFTKNRFVDQSGEQDFLHHFGIGFETGASLGYTLTPFKNKDVGLNIEGQYQFYSTRVEVSGVGDDQWNFGALHISVGLQF